MNSYIKARNGKFEYELMIIILRSETVSLNINSSTKVRDGEFE